MNILIWIKNTIILIFSVYFLIFGISVLWGSFSSHNPHEFIMLFFSASLMILICIVGIIYFIFRLFPKKQDATDVHDETQ